MDLVDYCLAPPASVALAHSFCVPAVTRHVELVAIICGEFFEPDGVVDLDVEWDIGQ